jgi:hypothetical protein
MIIGIIVCAALFVGYALGCMTIHNIKSQTKPKEVDKWRVAVKPQQNKLVDRKTNKPVSGSVLVVLERKNERDIVVGYTFPSNPKFSEHILLTCSQAEEKAALLNSYLVG